MRGEWTRCGSADARQRNRGTWNRGSRQPRIDDFVTDARPCCWRVGAGSARRLPRIWEYIAPPCASGASHSRSRAWRASRSTGLQANQRGCPRRWGLQAQAGCQMGRRAVASIERTGPMKSWHPPGSGLPALSASAPRCGSAVSARIYAPIGPRIAICEATRSSSRARRKHAPH
jgi:hypothetical protein